MADIDLTQFYERIDSVSPSTAAFGMDGGSAQIDFIVNRTQIEGFLDNILGKCVIDNASGKLQRSLPMAHPEFNWMYASKINTFQGVGLAGANVSEDSPISLVDTVDRKMPLFLAVYEKYRISVQYEPRPYLLLSDTQTHQYKPDGIVIGQQLYYTPEGAIKLFDDWGEYRRFTRIEFEPHAELLASNNGAFFHHSTDLPGGLAQPIGQANGAGPQIVVVKNKVKVTWFFVPYEMLTSINIPEAYGRISYEFPITNKFFGFPRGSLLFEGVTVNDYPGPFPTSVVNFGAPPDPSSIDASIYANKYCDIIFNFSHFEIPKELKAADPGGVLLNQCVISDHHNRLPHTGLMKYCYVSNGNDSATSRPVYWSYNFRKLFRFDSI